jgi:hypothetical protein
MASFAHNEGFFWRNGLARWGFNVSGLYNARASKLGTSPSANASALRSVNVANMANIE